MINNKSDKAEDMKPKDSERKEIKHKRDDEEAVVKPSDKEYRKKQANFTPPPAESKEKSEQPVNPVKEEPDEFKPDK